jgi:hypothetical protein
MSIERFKVNVPGSTFRVMTLGIDSLSCEGNFTEVEKRAAEEITAGKQEGSRTSQRAANYYLYRAMQAGRRSTAASLDMADIRLQAITLKGVQVSKTRALAGTGRVLRG